MISNLLNEIDNAVDVSRTKVLSNLCQYYDKAVTIACECETTDIENFQIFQESSISVSVGKNKENFFIRLINAVKKLIKQMIESCKRIAKNIKNKFKKKFGKNKPLQITETQKEILQKTLSDPKIMRGLLLMTAPIIAGTVGMVEAAADKTRVAVNNMRYNMQSSNNFKKAFKNMSENDMAFIKKYAEVKSKDHVRIKTKNDILLMEKIIRYIKNAIDEFNIFDYSKIEKDISEFLSSINVQDTTNATTSSNRFVKTKTDHESSVDRNPLGGIQSLKNLFKNNANAKIWQTVEKGYTYDCNNEQLSVLTDTFNLFIDFIDHWDSKLQEASEKTDKLESFYKTIEKLNTDNLEKFKKEHEGKSDGFKKIEIPDSLNKKVSAAINNIEFIASVYNNIISDLSKETELFVDFNQIMTNVSYDFRDRNIEAEDIDRERKHTVDDAKKSMNEMTDSVIEIASKGSGEHA